jgi:hypothetical protein
MRGSLFLGDWLGTVGTTFGLDWNFAEAVGALFGGGVGWNRGVPHSCYQRVHRSDYEEVDCAGNQEK